MTTLFNVSAALAPAARTCGAATPQLERGLAAASLQVARKPR